MTETIEDAEVIDVTGQEIEVRADAATTLFRTDEPGEIVARASAVADELSRVLKDRGLTTNIQGRDHVRVEGWTLLGTMLGVFPVVEWTRPVDGGWEARVEARTLAGAVVGAAEAECLRSEKTWAKRDDYALRSMAQTRATSKALRGPLGFVVSLAGYDPTPLEEMPSTDPPPVPATPAGGKDSRAAAASAGGGTTAAVVPVPTAFTPDGKIPKNLGKLVGDALAHIDPSVDWRATWENANRARYGDVRSKLNANDKAESLVRLAYVADYLSKGGDFPPPTDEEITGAFMDAFRIAAIPVERVAVASSATESDTDGSGDAQPAGKA